MAAELPRRWPWLIHLFRWYVRRYFARHFHALRLSRAGWIPDIGDRSGIVVMNHPSWWDPLVGGLLAPMFPNHSHFAPMDASSLRKFGFFRRLGFFPVDVGSPFGGLSFIRTCRSILARPRTMIWITAQGRFADPRERPLRLKAGIGHLTPFLGSGCIIPLALEYPFWNDRLPEALAHFGPVLDELPSLDSTHTRLAFIEKALESVQDQLALAAIERRSNAFSTILGGRGGINLIYDRWLRLRGRNSPL